MTRADHDIRVNAAQMAEMFTASAVGRHFAIGVDATAPGHAAGMATLLEGVGDLWHACGDGFDAASLPELAATAQAAKEMLGHCGKPQGSHKGERGYTFRSAAPVLAEVAPMTLPALKAAFPHAVHSGRFALVLGARSDEDRHVLLCLMVDQAGTMRPVARFASEWIDDLLDMTADILRQ